MFLIATIAAFGTALSSVVLANPKEYEATNCRYTGSMSDHCNASSGTQNVSVLRCTPGITDCYYTLPD